MARLTSQCTSIWNGNIGIRGRAERAHENANPCNNLI